MTMWKVDRTAKNLRARSGGNEKPTKTGWKCFFVICGELLTFLLFLLFWLFYWLQIFRPNLKMLEIPKMPKKTKEMPKKSVLIFSKPKITPSSDISQNFTKLIFFHTHRVKPILFVRSNLKDSINDINIRFISGTHSFTLSEAIWTWLKD